MKSLDSLKTEVLSLRQKLEAATEKWHAALLAAEPLKQGDEVRITTPNVKLKFDKNLTALSSTALPDTVQYGKVSSVKVVGDRVRVAIVGKLKGGLYGTRELNIAFDAKVEKL